MIRNMYYIFRLQRKILYFSTPTSTQIWSSRTSKCLSSSLQENFTLDISNLSTTQQMKLEICSAEIYVEATIAKAKAVLIQCTSVTLRSLALRQSQKSSITFYKCLLSKNTYLACVRNQVLCPRWVHSQEIPGTEVSARMGCNF